MIKEDDDELEEIDCSEVTLISPLEHSLNCTTVGIWVGVWIEFKVILKYKEEVVWSGYDESIKDLNQNAMDSMSNCFTLRRASPEISNTELLLLEEDE